MAAPDRSWTIAPTLFWFGVFLVALLWKFDGNLQALANRLTVKRDTTTKTAGPVFAKQPEVADTGSDEPPPKLPP